MKIYTSISGKTAAERESGASIVDSCFVNLAAAEDTKIMVIIPDGHDDGIAHRPEVNVINIGALGSGRVGKLRKIIRASAQIIQLYRSDPDGIFRVNSFFSSLLEIVPLIVYSRARARIFIQFHHKDESWLRNVISKRIMRAATIIICPSLAAKRDVVTLMGYVPQKLHVVHHGVDEKFFQKRVEHGRQPDFKPDYPLRLLFVGHLEDRKNPIALMMLAQTLYGKVDFELSIVGDGPELPKLQNACDNELWASAVSFLGELSDDDKLMMYRQSDLFVFPSKQEGFGLVLCEAMASGLPVLAFDTSAMSEIVTPHTGYLLPLNDIRAMAEVVVELAQNPALLGSLAASATEHAKHHFRWEPKVKEICLHLVSAFEPASQMRSDTM